MTTIQIRVDEETKLDSKKVFDALGLDISSAVKAFLRQVVITQGIPFQLITENGFTPAEEKEILKAAAEARRGKNISKKLESVEAVTYLQKLA